MNGWSLVRLGDVCEFEKEQGLHDGLPYVGLENIESGTGRFVGTTNAVTVKSSTFRFSQAHVLYGRLRPYLNKVLLPDFEGHCSTEIFPIKPGQGILRRYLFHWLSMDATVKMIDATSTGARMPRANMNAVLDFVIPLPSLPDQRRIVDIIDEAFDGIAAAEATAEKNLGNAREIYESQVQLVFASIGEQWQDTPLASVCAVKDGTHDSPQYVDDGVPFVTQKNIRRGGLSFANTKFISKEDHANFYRRSNVELGDILISMIGANRGMACLVDDDRTFSIKNVGLVKGSERFNPHFLLAYLKSPKALRYVLSGSKGGAQSFIGLTELRAFPVPVPPIDRQDAVAASLLSLSTETDRLQAIFEQKLNALNELRKSLLHQAFNGHLTAAKTAEEMEAVA